jgi:hypothetical protein
VTGRAPRPEPGDARTDQGRSAAGPVRDRSRAPKNLGMAAGLFLAWLDAVPTCLDELRLTREQVAEREERADWIGEAFKEQCRLAEEGR